MRGPCYYEYEKQFVKQRGIPLEQANFSCPVCGPLSAQMEQASGGSCRQYDQILRQLMELERQGGMDIKKIIAQKSL